MENLKATICLQKRVLDVLLRNANFYLNKDESENDRSERIKKIETDFERVDLIMSKIHIGDVFLLEDCDGGFEMNWFEQKVTNIIDKKLGIVECIEPNTFNGHLYTKKIYISSMITEEEFNIKFPQNTKLNGKK